MKLSDNFSLNEFTKSQTALRNDINNTPNKTQLDNLKSDWIHTHCTYDQLILEFYDGVNPNSGWVHVSYTDGENRYQYKQATRNEKGKVVYTLR